ncbi:MAG: ABC-F family ATP-binding cassette domain-containing protein [Clostridioides sp.]|jgi:ATP-binding cassette subfamily F protein 3|nr:ABC-F family ATP-binding cassette domain-containing protein [Clostridioides sp.]
MIVLSCNNISKSFGIDEIFTDVSFSVNEGDKIGIVGINGTGKTTLLKIIAGIYEQDHGNIYTAKSSEIGYLEQNMNFNSNRTILEEILTVFTHLMDMEKDLRELELAISKNSNNNSRKLDQLMNEYANKYDLFSASNGYGYRSEAIGVLRGLGFGDSDFDKPVSVLSGGEKTRLLLGKLLLEKPNILLLDEPTNHLDSNSIEWLELFLKQYNGTVMIISHDRYFLNQTVNRIFEINNRKLHQYNGNYTDFIHQSKLNREIERKKYADQQKEIKKQEQSIELLKSFGREKQVRRARSKEKALAKIKLIDKPESEQQKAKIIFKTAVQSGNDVLQLRDIGISYGEKTLFENLDLDVYRGEKIALIGANGIGKSTLFKIITGDETSFDGSVKFGANVEYSYFHQEQKTLNLKNTVIEEIWQNYQHLTQTEVRNILGSFLFKDDDVFKEISTLSGGERARIALLKIILSKPNFLLLDEPTNHLDIDSKEILEDALRDYDGTVFMISHDRYFINEIANKVLVLDENGISEYLGNYDYYVEKKKELNVLDSVNEVSTKTKTQLKEEKKKIKEQQEVERNERKKIKQIESDIELLEKQIYYLDEMLCLPDVYSDPEKSKEINQEKKESEKKLAKLYNDWENIL